MSEERRDEIQLGRGRVDLGRGLVHGPDGPESLSPNELALLLYFVRHPGRVLDRQELLKEESVVVEEKPYLTSSERRGEGRAKGMVRVRGCCEARRAVCGRREEEGKPYSMPPRTPIEFATQNDLGSFASLMPRQTLPAFVSFESLITQLFVAWIVVV